VLDCIQSSYVGTQRQEKENSQKLTNEQRKLIEDNLIEIKKILTSVFSKNKGYSSLGNPKDLVNEALSYLPDVTLEYQVSLSNTLSFARFATHRCLLRLIDEYRKMNRHTRVDRQKKKLIKSIQDKIEDQKGFCTEQDLSEAIKDIGKDPHKIMRINKCNKSSFDQADNVIIRKDKGLSEIEWSDFKLGILKQAEKFFQEYPDIDQSKAMSCRIYKILIKDYLLPKFEGAEGRLSQMIHGERMKRFIETAYS
jgi:hypothetical protein